MLLLILFAFLAGVVTVLSPCILPVLPIILSSASGEGKKRPLGVIAGFIASFTFFTLFLSTIVRLSGLPADSLRSFSIVVLIIFGLTLLIPIFQSWLEILFSRLSSKMPVVKGDSSFFGGLIVGLSLGLLWTPCVGPILASVISLSITGEVTLSAFFITLAYSLGTSLPMLMIMTAGSTALQKVPWLVRRTALIQKGFGLLMILTAVGILFNVDRKFQTFILQQFPNYGVGLTKLEDNQLVKDQLKALGGEMNEDMLGKPTSEVAPKGPLAPNLIPGGEWINSESLNLDQLRGKVVLVDFWTYSCINCQRTFPYLKNWWEKYKDQGLVIIGVHSPEFEFEKSLANVVQAAKDFGLNYPIVQDNEFSTWRAYKNRYWPAKYLIDKEGYIRYSHFGEGEYDTTERYIQNLLRESGAEISSEIENPSYQIYSQTPELYLGYSRSQLFGSQEAIIRDLRENYSYPGVLSKNHYAFSGEWLVGNEASVPSKGSKLRLRFESKEVYLVIRPKDERGGSLNVVIKGDHFGADVDKSGKVLVEKDRLYHLVSFPEAQEGILDLEFMDDNLEIYAFTFG